MTAPPDDLALIRRVAEKVAGTQPQWAAALTALLNERDTLTAENKALREALRAHEIERWMFSPIEGVEVWICKRCESAWDIAKGEPERHAPGCLARPE